MITNELSLLTQTLQYKGARITKAVQTDSLLAEDEEMRTPDHISPLSSSPILQSFDEIIEPAPLQTSPSIAGNIVKPREWHHSN